MKKRFYHWYNYLLSALFQMLGVGIMGCSPDGEEDIVCLYGPPVVLDVDSLNVDISQTIDNNYTPSLSEIQDTWLGQYEGWDENQQKTVSIKRKLVLHSDGTYTNNIQGKMVSSGKDDFFDFEHEKGTYTYNPMERILTYTVITDSVLRYDQQQMVGYTKKKYYDHEVVSYTENVDFTIENNGLRKWITRDYYLQWLNEKAINVAYAMNRSKDK